MIISIPSSRLWVADGPMMISGLVMGVIAYVRFITDVQDGLPLEIAYLRVNIPIFILGVLVAGMLGWLYANGSSTGPASIIPGRMFPPTIGERLGNATICGLFGLLANSGMMFSLGKLGHRPWLLVLCLLATLILMYAAVISLLLLEAP